jgi:hypothetical protein
MQAVWKRVGRTPVLEGKKRERILLRAPCAGPTAGAAALSRSLQGLLFGLAPLDPAMFLAVPATFVAVATLAAYVPARRAASVDPAITLRDE